MSSFFSELKRRNVVKVGIAYAITGWIVVEIGSILLPIFKAPPWILQVFTVLIVLGAPFALIIAWAFELTPDGLKKTADVPVEHSTTPTTGRKLDFVIISVLAAAVIFLVVDKFVLPDKSPPPIEATSTLSPSNVQNVIEGQPAVASHSIAVLPFVDMSPQQDQQYFADGISEEVLNLLAQIPKLRVIARTSSFSFKDQNADITEIADRLKVSHILEGSVRSSSDRIRITAQLVNASTSEHIWSETYDRTLDNVFAVQDDISENVVDRLRVTLLAPIPKARETDPEAHRFFLRAMHLADRSVIGEDKEAESFLRKSLQLEPNFAPAWRELSRLHFRAIGTGASLQEDIRRIRDTLSKALAIDPDDAASLAYRAWYILDFDGDIARAARLFERAISIAPPNEVIIEAAFAFAISVGRLEEAIAIGRYSVARNPLCQGCYLQLIGAYQLAGYLDDAEATIRTYQSLFGRGDVQLGKILLLKGKPQEALDAFGENWTGQRRLYGAAMALHDLGRSEESAAALASLLESSEPRIHWPIAKVYAWTGQIDAAFDAIATAAERDQVRSDGELIRWNIPRISGGSRDPAFRNLHGDPRWQDFLEKYGISAEQLADLQFRVTLPE